MELILASNSPRRKKFLLDNGYKFTTIASEFNENIIYEDATTMAKEFAYKKAKNVFKKINKTDIVVLGADTVVCCKGVILGKPADKTDAKKMLKFLSGKSHYVVSGYCVYTNNRIYSGTDKTEVIFNNLDDKLIDSYIESGLCWGKAGSYGIQDNFPLVKEYKGSLDNVIGLPTEKVFPILNKILNK